MNLVFLKNVKCKFMFKNLIEHLRWTFLRKYLTAYIRLPPVQDDSQERPSYTGFTVILNKFFSIMVKISKC